MTTKGDHYICTWIYAVPGGYRTIVSGEIVHAKKNKGRYDLEVIIGPHKGDKWLIDSLDFDKHFSKTHVRLEDIEQPKVQIPISEESIRMVEKIMNGLPDIGQDLPFSLRERLRKMFEGTIDDAIIFVASMSKETENFLLSRKGITRVENNFKIKNDPSAGSFLEIEYIQYWEKRTTSFYSEYVVRIENNRFLVYGSEADANRMNEIWQQK